MKKKERNKVYKTMLKAYEEIIKLPEFYGFCSLSVISFHYGNCLWCLSDDEIDLLEDTNLDDLIELISFKPTETFYTWSGKETTSEDFWFPVKNTEIRINILKQCIELTE